MLLAILVLSSILAISFSLATILFIEVRTSGDLLKTEGALYAAGGVGEEAFFNIKRQTCPQSGSGCSYSTSFANNVKLSGEPVTTTTSTPIFQDKININSPFGSSGQKVYDFCNVDTAVSSGCGYGKIEITYLDTGSNNYIWAYLCDFDPNADYGGEAPCSSTSNSSYWQNPGGTPLSKNSPTLTFNALNSARQQVLIITNPSTSGSAVFFQIKTYDTDGVTPKGLPYVGKSAVDVTTINSSVGRKIRVVVPDTNQDSATPVDTVWVEDDIPTGGVCASDPPDVCPWNKVSSNPAPYSGSYAFQSGIGGAGHQMYFDNATNLMSVDAGDTLFAYVYIDPANPPTEVMLQWNIGGDWTHRAYWGANMLNWSPSGTAGNYPMSASIPATGQWVRLAVPASAVGITGPVVVRGMAFTLYGGRATWDHAGRSR